MPKRDSFRPDRALPSLALLITAALALPACEEKDACDGIDNDGDGYVDEDLEADEVTRPWFPDADGDGFGDLDFILAPPVWACAAPEGLVNNNFDCDDADPGIHPDAPEVCNDVDDDCDGMVDDGVGDTYFADGDGDGYGDAGVPVVACEQPGNAADNDEDCDDSVAETHPGADEVCDGLDNDCDGDLPSDEEDGDGDGYIACEDCDDADPAVHPGAFEICDGIDANCDGAVDDGDNDGTGSIDCEEALVVVSWSFAQVQDLCPTTLDAYPDMETLAIADVLLAEGLGSLVVVEDELEGIFAEQMAEHPLVVVLNGGLPWSAGFFNDTLPALQRAAAEGVPLYVIGDDALDQLDDSAVMPALWGLEGFVSDGEAGLVDVADVGHPIADGPGGSLTSFAVDVDMDQGTVAGGGSVILAQAGNGHPALTIADPADGAPVVVQLFGVASAGDTCPITAGGESGIVARNVLAWLLQ